MLTEKVLEGEPLASFYYIVRSPVISINSLCFNSGGIDSLTSWYQNNVKMYLSNHLQI